MDDKPKLTPQEEAWHREQARRALDMIRVKNPTDEDFVIEWGKPPTYHRVPAHGTADLFRYLAVYYTRHMKDKIINTRNQMRHDKFMAERAKKGYPMYKSKWEENMETYETPGYEKTTSKESALPIYSDLWVGLVSEYGKDLPLPTEGEAIFTSDEVALLQSVEDRKVTQTPIAKAVEPQSPLVAPPIENKATTPIIEQTAPITEEEITA